MIVVDGQNATCVAVQLRKGGGEVMTKKRATCNNRVLFLRGASPCSDAKTGANVALAKMIFRSEEQFMSGKIKKLPPLRWIVWTDKILSRR